MKQKIHLKSAGFTPLESVNWNAKAKKAPADKNIKSALVNKTSIILTGFTLIELLVVISIIALLASVLLIALNKARIKARDTKRVGDISQVQKALELYYDRYGGYPAAVTVGGTQAPDDLTEFLTTLPVAPLPADGSCTAQVAPSPATVANSFYYVPQGSAFTSSGKTVYQDFVYYLCLGDGLSNFTPGLHKINAQTGFE